MIFKYSAQYSGISFLTKMPRSISEGFSCFAFEPIGVVTALSFYIMSTALPSLFFLPKYVGQGDMTSTTENPLCLIASSRTSANC